MLFGLGVLAGMIAALAVAFWLTGEPAEKARRAGALKRGQWREL